VKLRYILVQGFLIVSVVSILIVSIFGFSMGQAAVVDQINAHLETAGQSRAAHIETLLEEHTDTVEVIAIAPIIVELLSMNKDTEGYISQREFVQATLGAVMGVNTDISQFQILDETGRVIASTDEAFMGFDMSTDAMFLQGKKGAHISDVYFPANSENSAFDTAIPIFKADEFLGVVVARTKTDKLFDILIERTGWGETGETYLVNRDFYMVSPSRFREDVVLKQRVTTVNAQNCFNGLEEEDQFTHVGHEAVEVILDYRGIPVLGSHVNIKGMPWCLLAEFDEAESFAPLARLKMFTLAIALVIVAFVTILALYLSNSISKPLNKLTDTVEAVSKGKLDVQVEKSDIEEINRLADALDRVLTSMKRAIKRLREK